MTSEPRARRGPGRHWGVLALLWLMFIGWYTSFSGPLTPEEIDVYVARMQAAGQPAERVAELRAFLESDTGDDFVMVNAIALDPAPVDVPGMAPGSSAEAILGRYMDYMWPALLRRACHPVLMGRAAAASLDVFGIEGAERWSQAGLMRYRSRRDMMDVATNPAFREAHAYKVASMEKTIAFPIDPWLQLGDPRLVLLLLLALAGLSIDRIRGR